MLRFFIISLTASLFFSACTYTIKIRDGQTAYERRQFAVAIPMLKKEIERAKVRTERGKLAFMLGDAYRRTGQSDAALSWFNTAYENNYGSEALKAAAYELKKMERYAEAREAFKNLGIEIGSPYEYRKELVACETAVEWKKQSADKGWTIKDAPFNSSQNDFSPVIYADGRLVFTSDRAGSTGENGYSWTGNRFMDIFITDAESASPQNFAGALNTAGNEGAACFNGDFTEIFFVRAVGAYKGDDAFCKIYLANQTGGTGWSTPRPLPFQKDKINYMHPALSADGNTLFFACNDPDGWGGYDLYSVQRNPRAENGWDEPRLLSRSINSIGNELFPYLNKDTLYFASDGLPGMGGLDIFRTYKMERGAWAQPANLKAPLNSGGDDFGLLLTARQNGAQAGELILAGYFSSNRAGGRGGDDIYRFEQRVPPPAPVKADTLPSKPQAFKILLDVFVVEKIFSAPDDPNSAVLGRRPLPESILSYELNGKQQKITIGAEGRHQIEPADNTDYVFRAERPGYLTNTGKFSTKGMAKDPDNPVQTYDLEIVLDKIYRNREIVLENIYYDYDKWDIRPDAEPTLNRLAEVLKQNPAIRIQLGSHTDCRGNDNYNQDLSRKRAQSAVDYLIGRGIDAERLSAVGYGETQPAVDCPCSRCTEAEHQVNRRTTFKVVE
jgi:peptidoglycan-associated lipoprotein